MHDSASGNWIVFNGEIYNFREVREKLQKAGLRFQSNSDTEVLLKAYGHWGKAFLKELRGMFSFAIWDAREDELFIARDPMGIKPLYYGAFGKFFLFASEVRTLLTTGLVPRQLDPAGLLNYLTFGSVYDPITLIEGVSALRAGHSLVWKNGEISEEAYWNLPTDQTLVHPSSRFQRADAEEEITAELDRAVQEQMVSDVPVGVFLSGGIDSASLVGILSRHRIEVNTFSIVFREAEYSEAQFSRIVAKKFATNHHEILLSQNDVLESLPSAIAAMDQPTIDGVNTYFVSRHTRAAGIKVALSGLGGDELFAGYSSFREVPRMERYEGLWQHFRSSLRQPLATAAKAIAPDTDRNRKLLALATSKEDLVHPYFLSRMLFTPDETKTLLTNSNCDISNRANLSIKENLNHARELDPVNRVSYLETRCYMLNTLLRDSDFMSMAHGLEIRVPLIDHRLAEKMFHIPGEWKVSQNTPKPLLVGTLKGELPDEIVHRKKIGFTLPFEHWLRDELCAQVKGELEQISESTLAKVLDAAAVAEVWNRFDQRRTSWSRPWSLYILLRWCAANGVTA